MVSVVKHQIEMLGHKKIVLIYIAFRKCFKRLSARVKTQLCTSLRAICACYVTKYR